MGQIVNRGFEPQNQMQNGPLMSGQNPYAPMAPQGGGFATAYAPAQDMGMDMGFQDSLSSIPQGAADDGYQFAQQASMFRDASQMNRMGSPYGDDTQDLIRSLGDLFGMGSEGGNSVYDAPYGDTYGQDPMDFAQDPAMEDPYGSMGQSPSLGSFGQY